MRRFLLAIFAHCKPKLLKKPLAHVRDGARGPPLLETDGDDVGDIVGGSGILVEVNEADGVLGMIDGGIEIEVIGLGSLLIDGDTNGLLELELAAEADATADEEGLSITTTDVNTDDEGEGDASAEMDVDGVPVGSLVMTGDGFGESEVVGIMVTEGVTDELGSVLPVAEGVMAGETDGLGSALLDAVGDEEVVTEADVLGEAVGVGLTLPPPHVAENDEKKLFICTRESPCSTISSLIPRTGKCGTLLTLYVNLCVPAEGTLSVLTEPLFAQHRTSGSLRLNGT